MILKQEGGPMFKKLMIYLWWAFILYLACGTAYVTYRMIAGKF